MSRKKPVSTFAEWALVADFPAERDQQCSLPVSSNDVSNNGLGPIFSPPRRQGHAQNPDMNAPSFMDFALKAAETAGKSGEVPIGCVIVLNNQIVATAGNRTLMDRDATAHAEILAIRQASEAVGTERLVECDLYVTLEPCTMCAGAISFARIRRLYYGASDPKGGAVESGVRFFASPTCHHVPEVYSAVGEGEASRLLREFFKARR
jgi:tRNA(adenine34) deaminase